MAAALKNKHSPGIDTREESCTLYVAHRTAKNISKCSVAVNIRHETAFFCFEAH